MSKSVTKAFHGEIDLGQKRGISTIPSRRSGAMGAFATDSDKPRRHGPREERRGSGCALVERLRAVAPGETRDEAAPSNQLPRAADDEDHDADPAPEHPRRPGEKDSPRPMGADHHHIAPPEKRADAR